jgi:predicted DCC family thiol-disulfide oxidoreductase YuxK
MPAPTIILFDGICTLCNRTVIFLISRDPHAHFRFAPLQSPAAHQQLAKLGLPPPSGVPDSVLVIDRGSLLTRSDAALAIARRMPWPWRALAAAKLLPRPLRDFVYSIIARNRYRWFGRRDQCAMPTPELQSRFLENEMPQ